MEETVTRAMWEEGDILTREDGIKRQIVDVRPTGYGWRYPDMGDRTPIDTENYFWSENSCDPFFELGWTKEV